MNIRVQCALCIVQMCCVHCAMSIVCNGQCAMCNVCPVHCANVQCQDVHCVQWCIMSSVYSVALGFRELTDESSSAHLSALPAPLITYHFIFLIDIYLLCALILSLVTKLLAIMVLVITEISITWRTML